LTDTSSDSEASQYLRGRNQASYSKDNDDLDVDADDEWSSGSDMDELPGEMKATWSRPSLGCWVQGEIEKMYAHRYETRRDHLPQGPSYLCHVLMIQKHL
jgi:hypothetical protein